MKLVSRGFHGFNTLRKDIGYSIRYMGRKMKADDPEAVRKNSKAEENTSIDFDTSISILVNIGKFIMMFTLTIDQITWVKKRGSPEYC